MLAAVFFIKTKVRGTGATGPGTDAMNRGTPVTDLSTGAMNRGTPVIDLSTDETEPGYGATNPGTGVKSLDTGATDLSNGAIASELRANNFELHVIYFKTDVSKNKPPTCGLKVVSFDFSSSARKFI